MNNKAIVDDWRIKLALPLFLLIDLLLKTPPIAQRLFDRFRTPDNIRNILQVRQQQAGQGARSCWLPHALLAVLTVLCISGGVRSPYCRSIGAATPGSIASPVVSHASCYICVTSRPTF